MPPLHAHCSWCWIMTMPSTHGNGHRNLRYISDRLSMFGLATILNRHCACGVLWPWVAIDMMTLGHQGYDSVKIFVLNGCSGYWSWSCSHAAQDRAPPIRRTGCRGRPLRHDLPQLVHVEIDIIWYIQFCNTLFDSHLGNCGLYMNPIE